MDSGDSSKKSGSDGDLQRSLVLLMLVSFVIVSSVCVAPDARLDIIS